MTIPNRMRLRAAGALALLAAGAPIAAQQRLDWDGSRQGDHAYGLVGAGVPELLPELRATNRGRAFVIRNFDHNRDGRVNPGQPG